MALLCRIRHSRLECLSNQCKRLYFQIPGSSLVPYIDDGGTKVRVSDSFICPRPTELFRNVRFFAAPVQVKPKQEEKDPHGSRINNQITAEFVRLVTNEGHGIVSRREALERARKLKLDLVEVQRTAKPPVCKIMDFHKEKYKQQVKEKDRSKGKSEVTLRKGDCKEVRFSGKTEQKDLQMKADTVKRLMERGYRVKCMAMGTEDQDLGGLLSRLSALIEDISIVESGPRVEKRQAYTIVRHVKFGPSKKGPAKKATKVGESTSTEVQKVTTSPPIISSGSIQSPLQTEDDWKPTESGLETKDEIIPNEADTSIATSMEMPDGNHGDYKMAWSAFNQSDDLEKIFDFDDDGNRVTSSSINEQMGSAADTVTSLENTDNTNFLCPKTVPVSAKAQTVVSSLPEPSLGSETRYGKSEPRSKLPTTNSKVSTSAESNLFAELSKFSATVQRSQVSRGTDATNSERLGSQSSNQGRQPRSAVIPTTEEEKRLGANSSSFRNLKHPPTDNIGNREQSHPASPSSPAPSYGIFSAPKAAAAGTQCAATEVNRDKESSPFDSTKSSNPRGITPNQNSPMSKTESSQKPDVDKDRQRGWGVFSRENSDVNPSRISDNQVRR